MNAVITVVGKDKVGIIHGVSGILNDNNVNILNISQEIFKEFSLKNSLDISVQHEDIFNSMHRI